MIINQSNLTTLYQAFNAAFTKGMEGAESFYRKVAMVVPSTAAEEHYGWLGQLPRLREWMGDRVVMNLVAHHYAVTNRKFESTIAVPRVSMEDDRYGVFSPLLTEMGKSAGEHPDELVFSLLKAGFATNCYDNQFFFDPDHPVKDAAGASVSVSNMQAGAAAPWFLLDTSRAIKPMLYQERIPYKLTSLDRDSDKNVFFQDEYVYGVRARSNAGFGLWQLAFGSKADLTATNYKDARAAMMNFKGDEARPLNIKPDTLVVPPSLESAGRKLLNSEFASGGESNEWKGTANLVITQWVS